SASRSSCSIRRRSTRSRRRRSGTACSRPTRRRSPRRSWPSSTSRRRSLPRPPVGGSTPRWRSSARRGPSAYWTRAVQAERRLEGRPYYGRFAASYETRRHPGYHLLVDELEAGLPLPHAAGRDVLEVGCGTGLILDRVAKVARTAVGMDLSAG